MTAFYRLHWADAPEFDAGNAWSAPWGSTFSEDGSQTQCPQCDGTGTDLDESCPNCDGEGWLDCTPGYSCCNDPSELLAYFGRPGMEPQPDDTVIIFEGRQVGDGLEGEPTATPNRVIERLTWAEFTARYA